MGHPDDVQPPTPQLVELARYALADDPEARGLSDAAIVDRLRTVMIARRAVAAERQRHPVLTRLGDLIDRSRALVSSPRF